MHRGQLDNRIEQILYQVDNQRMSVETAANEISQLVDELEQGVIHEEKKVAAV